MFQPDIRVNWAARRPSSETIKTVGQMNVDNGSTLASAQPIGHCIDLASFGLRQPRRRLPPDTTWYLASKTVSILLGSYFFFCWINCFLSERTQRSTEFVYLFVLRFFLCRLILWLLPCFCRIWQILRKITLAVGNFEKLCILFCIFLLLFS